jgi:hypothetical protein
MTDGSLETLDGPAAVRAAADRLGVAVAAHLAAVENKEGEQDPAVQAAYAELKAAAAAYDDLLFDAHGEVTPFDIDDDEEGEDDDEGPVEVRRIEGPPRFSVLARWDYTIFDPGRLVQAASEAVEQPIDDLGVAMAALIDAKGHSEVANLQAAMDAGLRWHGMTSWVLLAADADADTDSTDWMDDAFDYADPEEILCRVDTPVTWRRGPAREEEKDE